jgi:DNA repair exonuclease SbcCD nuclease subunit
MSNLFRKAAIFTDLHLGYKSNSAQFLADCENYVTWFIDLVKREECDIILFLGDILEANGLNPSYTRQTDNAFKGGVGMGSSIDGIE